MREKEILNRTKRFTEKRKSFLLHGNGVVEQYERRDFVAIQASLMNFITFDHYHWVSGFREIS